MLRNKIIGLVLAMLIGSCSSSQIVQLATQGTLSEEAFKVEIPCYYIDKYIFIELSIQNKSYTFLFDTGADITTIDKGLLSDIEFVPLKKYTTTGSAFEAVKLQYGCLSSLTIGGVEFKKIGVGIQDLSHVKSPFADKRKIHGIIGANILRKAFWQIDYQKQSIKFSNEMSNFPPASNAYKIAMIPKSTSNWGLTRINVSIHGQVDNFVFDTGSYGSFTANPPFLEQIENGTKPLVEVKKNSQSNKRKFILEKLKIDGLEFENQELSIEKNVDLLIGNDFWEDFVVTIDWRNNQLYLEPIQQ